MKFCSLEDAYVSRIYPTEEYEEDIVHVEAPHIKTRDILVEKDFMSLDCDIVKLHIAHCNVCSKLIKPKNNDTVVLILIIILLWLIFNRK